MSDYSTAARPRSPTHSGGGRPTSASSSWSITASRRRRSTKPSPCRSASSRCRTTPRRKLPLRQGHERRLGIHGQVRPSTGTADRKESYQITLPRMAGLWPTAETCRASRRRCWPSSGQLGARHEGAVLLRHEARLRDGLLHRLRTTRSPEYQSTLRLLHYLPMIDAKPEDFRLWRAGAHTDFDCLTLLHQRPGQGGLQLCPGKESAEHRMDRCGAAAGRHHLQHRRHADALERRHCCRPCTACGCRRPTNISARAIRSRSSARPTRTPSSRGRQELRADHRARLLAAAHRGKFREESLTQMRRAAGPPPARRT